jgi:polyisoprenoid-binding protein YceI
MTTKWILDQTHSDLGFKIRHLMISNVSGLLKNFSAEIETQGDDFSTASIVLTADMSSITTNNEQRDAHLRTSDFFGTELYPELKFVSTNIQRADEDSFTVNGDLTMKGKSNPVSLNVEFNGITKDPWGNQRAGFSINGKINRSDWGINFNSLLETGGVALSEEVKINSEIQFVKQAVNVAA